jgi:AraC-like DNA-binding protein/ligand-binding sensor protein
MDRKDSGNLIDAITSSKVYRDFEQAFAEATGLPVSLQPVESWLLPLHGKKNENPFCAAIAKHPRACGCCLQVQQELSERARATACTIECELGISITAVPVHLGDKLIGFLQTGQVLRQPPVEALFEPFARKIAASNTRVDMEALRQLYFESRVISPKQYEAIVGLLSVFADHISLVCNQIVLQQQNAEPPAIQRAKEYIEERQEEDLSLCQVAKVVNTSTFHFCKLFRKTTGLTFTDYVSRVRIEKAKNLLLNPNLRVNEIAYQVGFQSLTHFNRVFKKVTGQSPSRYRATLFER